MDELRAPDSSGTLSVEGVNPRLAGTELGPTLLEKGGGFVVNCRDDRGTVDEGDSREGLVGDRQIP